MSAEIWAFAENEGDALSEVSQEVLTEGKKLAAKLGKTLCGVLLGHGVESFVGQLASYGAHKVYLADMPVLRAYAPDTYASALAGAVGRYSPDIIIFANTLVGRDLAATLAGRLQTGLAPNCSFIDTSSTGEVQAVRPVFAGKGAATITFTSRKPWLVTMQTGVISISRPISGTVAEIVRIDHDAEATASRTATLGLVKGDRAQLDLTEADVIVAGGRGVGRAENFRLIEELATTLGGKVAGSRYAVDAGWISRDKQIGQSGKMVAPKLYIACGISGAVHHVTGMRDSKAIIAINKDRTAPIFKIADLGIVGDLLEVIPSMLERVRKGQPAAATR